jgi:hypothetical protein
LANVSLLCFAGCSRPEEIVQTPRADAPRQATQAVQNERRHEGVDVKDLMDLLRMTVWKDTVNEGARPPVKKVALCVRAKGTAPKVVLGFDLPAEDATGTLLVSLQEWPERRFKATLVYRGAHGRSKATWGFVDDPITEGGSMTEPGAYIGRVGIIGLRRTGFPISNSEIETHPEEAAIYLKNE